MVRDHFRLRTSMEVNYRKWGEKNTMVSNRGHVAQPDAFWGEKMSIPNHFASSSKSGVYTGVDPCYYFIIFQITGTFEIGMTSPLEP
jgi:hypothetical protein